MTRENTVGNIAEALTAMLLIGFGVLALMTHADFGECIRTVACNVGQIWRWWPMILIVIGASQLLSHTAHKGR